MSESEYSEENLDDFIKKASSVLSKENHPDRDTIIESLKQHLASIFNDQNEMENLFKTLNSIITNNKGQKISNKKPFILYPLIVSFNPKLSAFYIDYYLTTLQLCAAEENRKDFPFLSSNFGEVINYLYSDDKTNKNLIKRNALLEPTKKVKLYEKLFNFCYSNIKKSNAEQTFGCLLLTEFIEKCPMTKDEKNLEYLFKVISGYLDNRWFGSKLDILNCTLSLIFSAEKKFKPYAKKCLFKIIDFLTDEEWVKRKIAINIIYTLLFYCKEEILPEKDNIIDFLSGLKNDQNKEVREVCNRTLNYIDDLDPKKAGHNKSFNLKRNNFKKMKSSKTHDKTLSMKKNETDGKVLARPNKKQEMLEKLEKEYNDKKIKFENTKKGINNSYFKPGEENNESKEELREKIHLALYDILQQIKKIREQQNELYNIYDDVKQTIDNNYTSLNDRLKLIESSNNN